MLQPHPKFSKSALYQQFMLGHTPPPSRYDQMLFGVVNRLLEKGIEYKDTGWDVVAFEQSPFCQELYMGLEMIATSNSDTNFVWVFTDEAEPDDEWAISHLEIKVNSLLSQIKAAK